MGGGKRVDGAATVTGIARSFGERLDRRAEARLGQDRRGAARARGHGPRRWPSAARSWRREQLRAQRSRLAGDVEPDREGREPLLGAVVEVTLDAPPLRVGRLHDPGPRRHHLLELGADLRREPLVRERESRDGSHGLDQRRVVRHGLRVVDEHREQLAILLDARDDPAHRVGLGDGAPGLVDPAGPVRRREGKLERRVAQGPGEDRPEAADRHAPPQLQRELGDVAAREGRLQGADHDRDRQDRVHDDPDPAEAVRRVAGRLVQQRVCEVTGEDAGAPDRGGDHHRQQDPPAGRPGIAPVPDDHAERGEQQDEREPRGPRTG